MAKSAEPVTGRSDAREDLVRLVYAEVPRISGAVNEVVDAILANPSVVVRALIAAGHSTLTLADGVPVYLLEVK